MIKLKDIYLFKNLELELLKFIIDNSRRVEFAAEDIIIKEGEKSDGNAYILQKGQAVVNKDYENLSMLEAPDIFGEIALITDEPRTATIEAKTEIIALKINKKLLCKIIKEFPNGDKIQKIIQSRIMENLQRQKLT